MVNYLFLDNFDREKDKNPQDTLKIVYIIKYDNSYTCLILTKLLSRKHSKAHRYIKMY